MTDIEHDEDDSVTVWVDACGRSWVTAADYVVALEQRDHAREQLRALKPPPRSADTPAIWPDGG